MNTNIGSYLNVSQDGDLAYLFSDGDDSPSPVDALIGSRSIWSGIMPNVEDIDLYGFIYSEDGFSESRNEIDVRLYPLLSRPEAQWDIYSTYKAALEAKDDELAKYSEYTVIFIDEISGKTEEIEV